jgi:hypothetical protein
MTTKIFLGRTASDFTELPDEPLFIAKHSFDCGWYWGFGYIGNKNLHMHIESLINSKVYKASEIFSSTKITDSEWRIVRDLFIQAYALKAAAEVYRIGGHQTTRTGVTDIIKNPDMADKLNADLKTVLDTVWNLLMEINARS